MVEDFLIMKKGKGWIYLETKEEALLLARKIIKSLDVALCQELAKTLVNLSKKDWDFVIHGELDNVIDLLFSKNIKLEKLAEVRRNNELLIKIIDNIKDESIL